MQTVSNSPASSADSLPFFKQLIKDKNAELRAEFDPHRSVLPLLHAKSDFIDAILVRCWRRCLEDMAPRLSLIAVGGYGRRELFPYSDIDIMVLLDEEDATLSQDALVQFFTFLWDIGLKPGQSVRTIKECVEAASDDQTIMTSLMEMRLVAGNHALFDTLKANIGPDKIWPSDRFFAAKMAEQQQRYAKFHDTAYNLEPNIKEGPGGLRDRQVIAWVFKRHYNSSTLKELIKHDFLPISEYNELMRALEVLWRIRYALHLLTNRGEDRLVFDYQRELAAQFGFSGGDQHANQDVELFMQFYFKTVLGLERLNEMLLQLFQQRFIVGTTEIQPIPDNDHFLSVNGYLEATDEHVFNQHPLALFEIILILQQNPELKGVHATTIRLIRKSLHLIDDNFRRDKTANRLFIEIFRQPNGLTHELRRMNRYGLLAAYLPSFANIVARMQYDLFHIYTVDEHTLFLIRNLRRFSIEKHNHELPLCSQLFLQIDKPELLYLAALFHDIAKGGKGDHSTLGADIAREFCAQHDLSAHDTKLICWLVRYHLMMSMTAQRKDISDPKVIHEFAQQVGSVEYLNHLYLLTVADIRATNPDLWNTWKDSLLKELYSATHSMLRRGLPDPATQADRILETQQEARAELLKLGLSETDINASWRHANDDYFLRYSIDEIAWHTVAIASSSEDELPLVLLRPQTLHGSAEVFVYTKNVGNVFSISTATLDQLGLNVLDARIMTTTDNYVLNSFQVLEQNGRPINDLIREVHICSALRNNLLHQRVREQRNVNRQSRMARHFPIPTSVSFHDDPLCRCTIVELITTDSSGLLSKIGRAFVKQRISLHNAKITTIGSRVEDIFYVTDDAQLPITDPNRQARLKAEIIKELEG